MALEKYKYLKFGRTKLALFSLVTTGLFFIAGELILFLCGVAPIFYATDPYVGFTSNNPLFVESHIANGQTLFVTAENKLRYFNAQHFPKEKASGTFRIFCMGGSTTYGRPFNDQTSFCGWLRAYLTALYPSRLWEVINAGGISYASYRVIRLMEEITQYHPDLFIVYSGHNEFLEARTYSDMLNQSKWIAELDSFLNRTRVYTVFKKVINHFSSTGPELNRNDRRPQLSGEVDALLDHSVGPDAYIRDTVWHKNVLTHYRFNLQRIVKIADAIGARLVFVTPASNLKNSAPFKSEHDGALTEEQLVGWSALFRHAKEARQDRLWLEAHAYLKRAEAIDRKYADMHYRLGQIYYSLGDFDNAKNAFQRAVDEDICPLRAVSSIPSTVKEVAVQYSVPVVDFIALLESDSYQRFGHKILGAAHFYDHVHPVIRAHRILAISLMRKLVELKILGPSPLWNKRVFEETTRAIMSKVDRKAQGVALKNLAKVLSWAGKSKEAARLSNQALRTIGPDAELYFILGLEAYSDDNPYQAIMYYRKATRLEPDYIKTRNNLGIVLADLGEFDQAITEYRTVIRLQPDHADAHFNLGNALMERDKPRAAIKHYRKALSINPADETLRTLLNNIQIETH